MKRWGGATAENELIPLILRDYCSCAVEFELSAFIC
jgi:hypothetical protein